MSDMQFCKAQMRAVKAQDRLIWNQLFDRRRRNSADPGPASASGAPKKKPHRKFAPYRLNKHAPFTNTRDFGHCPLVAEGPFSS